MRLPSFSDWIHGKSLQGQVMLDMTMRGAPFIVGYYLLVFYYVTIKPKTIWEMVSGPMFAVPALVMACGSMIVESMRRRNINVASENLGVNMTLYWTPQEQYDEVNIIEYINPLKESAFSFGDLEEMENMEKQYIYGKLLKYGFRPGRYYYEIGFKRQMDDLHGEKWSRGIFLCDFPAEDIFRRIPNQMMMHNGTVFTTAAASIAAFWCTEYSEIEEFRVFRIMVSPQHAYIAQIGLGLLPVEVDKDAIEEAAQLNIDHTAIRYMIRSREAEAKERTITEESRDSREIGYGLSSNILRRSKYIREPSRLEQIKSRSRAILLIAAFGLIVFLYWYFRVR